MKRKIVIFFIIAIVLFFTHDFIFSPNITDENLKKGLFAHGLDINRNGMLVYSIISYDKKLLNRIHKTYNKNNRVGGN